MVLAAAAAAGSTKVCKLVEANQNQTQKEVEEVLFGNRTGRAGVRPSMQPETAVATGIALHVVQRMSP